MQAARAGFASGLSPCYHMSGMNGRRFDRRVVSETRKVEAKAVVGLALGWASKTPDSLYPVHG
jgi:hypothetical protein